MAEFSTKAFVLFSNDLRTKDNPALYQALQSGYPVLALYIEPEDGLRPRGGASNWWLHHSLNALSDQLDALNVPLVLRRGNAFDILKNVAQETDAKSIFWNRRYDKDGVYLGANIKQWARETGLDATSFNGLLLHEPHSMLTKTDGPYRVFTPFWKAFLSQAIVRSPLPTPQPQKTRPQAPQSEALSDWKLLPTSPNWATGFDANWTPGEAGALTRLNSFLSARIGDYSEKRDFPSIDGTSGLSPHLRFGEISPYQIWAEAHAAPAGPETSVSRDKFIAELGWREFSHHLLYHYPDLHDLNYNLKFNHFPWRSDDQVNHDLEAWQKGQTGYPIVDAGMRQLWQTGYMHNRVRMIVGSFLVKHLLIDWREGERWFWDTLVDACPAANTASWQWIAGSGADAAPYFRIFNPVLQGEKFDAAGDYVRTFVPELAKLPHKLIHKPWTGRASELSHCGVRLGESYPHPIVEHKAARQRALDAFATIKTAAA
ncbi:MAG: deoxyribodipyrimidine photo-lyase [Pseudomonadota bacterium]